MKVLDLFSGIGGFSLGLQWAGMETIAFCEIEPFCQKLLKQNFPGIPVFNDIRTLHGSDLPEYPRLVCGGYPCQPFSCAGRQRGADDDRHLWPEMYRLLQEIRPDWVICENVAGHIRLGLDTVLSDLESIGYTCQPFVVPACAVGAVHRRDRVWIIANRDVADGDCKQLYRSRTSTEQARRFKPSNGIDGNTEHHGSLTTAKPGSTGKAGDGIEERQASPGQPTGTTEHESCRDLPAGQRQDAADTDTDTAGRRQSHEKMADGLSEQPDGPPVQSRPVFTDAGSLRQQGRADEPLSGFPNLQSQLARSGTTIAISNDGGQSWVPGVNDGFPGRVDRIKGLGNAVVPQVVEILGRVIMHVDKQINYH